MKNFVWTTILLLAVATTTVAHGKVLTDDDFEHTTQANTGQTTGIWVVRFCSEAACSGSQAEWEETKADMMHSQVFLADVDVDASPALAKRFSIETLPTFVMLRRQKMFKRVGDVDMDSLVLWIDETWEDEEGLKVPSETPALLEVAREALVAVEIRARALLASMKSGDVRSVATTLLPVLVVSLVLLLAMALRSSSSSSAKGARAKKE